MIDIVNQNLNKIFNLFLFIIILNSNAFAQELNPNLSGASNSSNRSFSNSINMCPISVAFGLYSFNYEYLSDQTHGLIARFDYESISDSYSDNPIEVGGYGFILNYRYHLSGDMESIFLGSYARYRIYDGNGISGTTNFDFKVSEFTVGLNAGKRWVWNSGLNITFALGYGISSTSRETEPSSSSIESTINSFEDKYTFIGPFLGEFSIGFAF